MVPASGRRRQRLLTDVFSTLGDHLPVNLVYSIIDYLQIVGVGDDFIVGEDVLRSRRPRQQAV
jgi:hypothetical protein